MMEDNDGDLLALTDAAHQLIARVDALTSGTGDQMVTLSQYTKRTRRYVWALGLMALVTVGALTLGLTNLYVLNHVTEQIQRGQTVGRQRALCPLYRLFLDSKNDRARSANPKGPEAYDEAFAVIQDGYDALKCDEFAGGAPKLGSN